MTRTKSGFVVHFLKHFNLMIFSLSAETGRPMNIQLVGATSQTTESRPNSGAYSGGGGGNRRGGQRGGG